VAVLEKIYILFWGIKCNMYRGGGKSQDSSGNDPNSVMITAENKT
jgi:hypothetical protein